MKHCPVCGTPLARASYEALPVFTCPRCHGYLIGATRLEAIERRPEAPPAELRSQAEDSRAPAERSLTCPTCAGPMRTERRRGDLEVDVDCCPSCALIWLDAGEIALLQLAYEASMKGRNNQDLRRRHQELLSDPERLARYERNRDRLPPGAMSVLGGFAEGLKDGIRCALWFAFGDSSPR